MAGCCRAVGATVMRRVLPAAFGFIVMAMVIWAWHEVVEARLVSPVFLPGPSRVWRALADSISRGVLWPRLTSTLWRMAIGWLLASLIGVLLGLVIGLAPRVRAWLQPTLEFLRPLPASAVVPVAIALFGLSDRMVIVVIAFGALWPMLLGTVQGCASLEPRLLEVARVLRLSQLQIAWKIAVPSALPDIVAAMRVGLTIALILTVVGEMLGGREGIGSWILVSARAFRPADLFAGVVVLGLIGSITAQMLNWIERMLPAMRNVPHRS